VRQLEDDFCEYLGIKYAIATNSATSALHTALLSLGVGRGDSVEVPDVTFSATASSVYMANATPHLVDIDEYYTMKPCHGKYAIPVHLHGQPADLDNIRCEYIIEDCSQAIGAEYKGRKVGTIGDFGVFSFNVWKHISSGEGGMLVTNDDELARKARLIRNHGEVCSEVLGYNYRMPELCGAVLLPQFRNLHEQLERRREVADRLNEGLREAVGIPEVRDGCKHSYYTYAIKTNRRDELQQRLSNKGVYFGKGGYRPLHHIPFYQGWGVGEYPYADECYETVMFSDGIGHWTLEDADKIIEVIND